MKDLSERVERVVLDNVGRAFSRVQERTPLPADLLESDDAYLVVFDAPGATGDDIDVRFDENTVRVRIDRFRDYYEDYEMRIPGRGLALDGAVTLPEGATVDPRTAEATLTSNGTLRVRIPKTEDERDVPVDVTTEDDADADEDEPRDRDVGDSHTDTDSVDDAERVDADDSADTA
ncbi:Hsp20/alpha crystallin family protein [Halomarina ordinaria]|uniref:Hsp20/alpha crystallin family protein n=1 Tax=Halomarina ordinaria TaxID=3033939 RepID=A0ABD5UCA7_9EURY|nr:Hsp20/alpha crystallin family protein [Halomarina sp. PSRA2]